MDYVTTASMSGRSICGSIRRSQDGACSEKGKDFQVITLDYHEKRRSKRERKKEKIIKEITIKGKQDYTKNIKGKFYDKMLHKLPNKEIYLQIIMQILKYLKRKYKVYYKKKEIRKTNFRMLKIIENV